MVPSLRLRRYLFAAAVVLSMLFAAPARSAPPSTLYAALTADITGTGRTFIEGVDLRTLRRAKTFRLGVRRVTALAVSPRGGRLYALDSLGVVLFLNARTGRITGRVAAKEVRDLALSPDGRTLALSAAAGIVFVDTRSRRVRRTVSTPEGSPLGIAYSPGGAYVAATVPVLRGSSTVLIIKQKPFAVRRVRLAAAPNCPANTWDVEFAGGGRILARNLFCGIFQIATRSAAQLPDKTIVLGPAPHGVGRAPEHAMAYSSFNRQAFALNAGGSDPNEVRPELFEVEPDTGVFEAVSGFDGVPQGVVPSANGRNVFVSVAHDNAPSVLARFRVASGTLDSSIYKFSRDGLVRAMAVGPGPR